MNDEANAAWEKHAMKIPDRVKVAGRLLIRMGWLACYPVAFAAGVEAVRRDWREEMRGEVGGVR